MYIYNILLHCLFLRGLFRGLSPALNQVSRGRTEDVAHCTECKDIWGVVALLLYSCCSPSSLISGWCHSLFPPLWLKVLKSAAMLLMGLIRMCKLTGFHPRMRVKGLIPQPTQYPEDEGAEWDYLIVKYIHFLVSSNPLLYIRMQSLIFTLICVTSVSAENLSR